MLDRFIAKIRRALVLSATVPIGAVLVHNIPGAPTLAFR